MESLTGPVNEIADVISGYAFKSGWFGCGSDKVIRISDLQDGWINTNTAVTFDSEEHTVSDDFRVKSGDILMALSGATTGKIAIATPSSAGTYVNQRVAIIRGKASENAAYLKYVFSGGLLEKLLLNAGGAAQPNLSPKALALMEIPLPPLPEQKRIAAILDKADAIRRKRQQAIQLADQLLRAVFLEMFGDPVTNPKGWDELVLKDIADIRSGVTKGKKIDSSTAVTLPYMRVANVQDGYLDLGDVQNITVSPKDAEKCRLESGDILLTEGGDPDKLGRGYVWHGEVEGCIHQNHIFSVRVHNPEQVNPIFLSAVISSQRGKRYFLKVGKQTTGIATINKTVLSEFVPIVPPYDVQMKYIAAVRKVEYLKGLYQSSSLNIFESISQKAFVGEL
ncbi:MAG: restriction endonuclease subunit S [Candidatus Polarisedimenticolaceae bacterium]|nr:restriction endonuclease subunit S [Candidatus Polarisedimenticolaceae bacterium]